MSIFLNLTAFIIFFILSIGCLFAFQKCQIAVGGKYLDSVVSYKEANELISELDVSQARNHLYITIILDSLYIICYGFILFSIALFFSRLEGVWRILPALAAVLSDLLENITQILALLKKTGRNAVIGQKYPILRLKSIFSILKWFFISVAIGCPFLSYFASL